MDANFWAWVSTPTGLVVPSSRRSGHNTLTAYGAQWFSELVSWAAVGASDAANRSDRLRWIMLGSGSLPETSAVQRLESPLTITTGPDVYLTVLPAAVRQPTSSLRFTVQWTGASADLDHHGASVDISEAGLFVDEDAGSGPGLSPASSDHPPVFYRSFAPVTKAAAQNFTIVWELRN